ncbi:acyltransferase [Vibrio sp. VB16]|uniref:acyltransferase n=1 Tax=Vibrio sp. VB16 TaxID=2785746 RepID=UPI00189D9BD3|nr:acyltransferase [Vibrio sp. VB16]UGA57734.1 acyltransferase [Vibrio sp. VB16]
MMTLSPNNLKNWLKQSSNPYHQKLFSLLKSIRTFDMPTPKALNKALYFLLILTRNFLSNVTRIFLYTPAFKGRVHSCGKNLYLYTGIPFISGPLSIDVGENCRISGQTTFSGRSTSHNPSLIIGNNVGIGWQTTMAVGTQIVIGNNVRIAGRSSLFGYSGHPFDAKKRAAGDPDLSNQTGDITLEDDVWLGSNVTVNKGVTIGKGTIVATGSVVTKSLPCFVLAAGNPAKIIRAIG